MAVGYHGGYRTMISHRSGETEDTMIAPTSRGGHRQRADQDGASLAVSARSKYNQLPRSEEALAIYMLGDPAFLGSRARRNRYMPEAKRPDSFEAPVAGIARLGKPRRLVPAASYRAFRENLSTPAPHASRKTTRTPHEHIVEPIGPAITNRREAPEQRRAHARRVRSAAVSVLTLTIARLKTLIYCAARRDAGNWSRLRLYKGADR